jgi:hypothetical protein
MRTTKPLLLAHQQAGQQQMRRAARHGATRRSASVRTAACRANRRREGVAAAWMENGTVSIKLL